jgi:CBS domain-containing protein
MRIDSLHSVTSARLVVIDGNATLRTAAVALSKPHLDLIVVCDERRRATGVVSKSDIVRHVATLDVTDAPVAVLMSRRIVSCGPEDDLYATWRRMAGLSLQNMPVLDGDASPLGVLDIRGALKALFEQEEYEERLLVNYVAGVGYQ